MTNSKSVTIARTKAGKYRCLISDGTQERFFVAGAAEISSLVKLDAEYIDGMFDDVESAFALFHLGGSCFALSDPERELVLVGSRDWVTEYIEEAGIPLAAINESIEAELTATSGAVLEAAA